jgi:membrane-associated phospholipid phosphatase
MDEATLQQIRYWNAGAPNYRWQELMNKLWMTDTSRNGALANMLLGTAIYDAMVAAWDTKYAYNRPRPFTADKRVKAFVLKPESPSYPCEHSVAAGVAVSLITHFYPHLADSVNRMAQRLMDSRMAAGVAYPSDTKGGFELGKRIAAVEIEKTKDLIYRAPWDGKMPQGPGVWRGKNPMAPFARFNKTVVLDSASQFRPGPPPDFAKEMDELKAYKQNFRSQSNAWYWASQDFWSEALNRKLFEHNLHLNPPRAARVYAVTNVAAYDGFIACFDAKYAYWGIRPNQYDTTYQPLVPTPPFPGYPSGHAMMSGMFSELYAWFFPEESANFRKKAKDAAESRFQAGIHFRSDNEVGLELGRKIAGAIIKKLVSDGAGVPINLAEQKPVATTIRGATAKTVSNK